MSGGDGDKVVEGYKLAIKRRTCPGDLMCIEVIMGSNTASSS